MPTPSPPPSRPILIAPQPTHAAAAAASAVSVICAEGLCQLDVLLRKGGRPTHGKKQFFEQCERNAAAYASFKSPIDRRLLARKLVEDWMAQGGRFCIILTNKAGHETSFYRVASSEEAIQFTRRVLVRHFTSSYTTVKRKGPFKSKLTTKKAKSVVDHQKQSSTTTTTAKDLPSSDVADATTEAADALCFLRVAVLPDPSSSPRDRSQSSVTPSPPPPDM